MPAAARPERAPRVEGPPSLAPLAVVFAATGACALAYEVVWARSLSLLLGVDAYAHAVVLACFMGGQAAGYVWGGRLAAREGRRIARYGALEAAIGLLAVIFPLTRWLADQAFLAIAGGLEPGGAALFAVKLPVACALLLPSTVLMGATFPLLAEGAARAGHAGARATARLYAANAFGAVLGALVAGYILLPDPGMRATMIGVGAVNLAAAGVAVLLARLRYEAWAGGPGLSEEAGLADEGAARFPSELSPRTPALARIAVVGAFATGAAALAYEVAWTRLLALSLGASTYAFTIVLAAFILGISLGAWLAGTRRVAALRSPLAAFGAVQLAIGLAVTATLPLADILPLAFERLRALLPATDRGFAQLQLLELGLALLVLAPPTILGGAALPLAARAVALLRGPAQGVSRAFAANTLGSLAGALAAGLVLLPLVGLRHTFTAAIACNAVAGALALAASPGNASRRLLAPVLGGVVILASLVPPPFERGALTFQVFRSARRADPASRDGSVADFQARARKRTERIEFDRDGAAATVTVMRAAKDKLTLLINGKADASTGDDMRTQILLAHVPLLLRPEAKEVLVVGLGSGVTAGSALTHPITRLDIVELSPEVVEASRLFDGASGAPLADLRTHLVVDDARTVLRLSRRRYDVVISEPSNPWVAGIGNLFTREHFQAIADRLAPGGVALQWIHLYEISDEVVDLVVQSWLSVFPHVRVFAERAQQDLFLVGSLSPLDVDLPALEARMALPRVASDLARDGLTCPEALLALELYGPAQARALPRPRAKLGDLHTDDRPLVETEAPRAFFRGATARGLVNLAFSTGRPPEPPLDRLLERLLARRPATKETRAAVRAYLGREAGVPWPELEPEEMPAAMPRRSRLAAPVGAK